MLLLEAGGQQALSRSWPGIISRLPTALAMPMHHAKYNWAYKAEPEPALEGRVVSCPRGKGIGGSSSINGMVYVRGHPRDFDAWDAVLGADGAERNDGDENSPCASHEPSPIGRWWSHNCWSAAPTGGCPRDSSCTSSAVWPSPHAGPPPPDKFNVIDLAPRATAAPSRSH